MSEITPYAICDMPNCTNRAPVDHPFCAKHRVECASTHCERRGECASPSNCTGDRQWRIDRAIDDFNAQELTEDYYGTPSRIRARKPILATDCDYEIVRISGVQGVRLK